MSSVVRGFHKADEGSKRSRRLSVERSVNGRKEVSVEALRF